MRKTILITLGSAVITAAAIKASPALAQQQPATARQSQIVRTADLNLASPEGQRALDRRLSRAARAVCGTASDFDIAGQNAAKKCRDATLASIRPRRDALLLSAAAQGGQTTIAVAAAR